MLRLASHKIRREARKRSIDYSFLFMRADGAQLTEIARLVDVGAIRPVIDHVFGFDEMPAAMERMKFERSCGKIVIQVARDASLAAPGA